MNSTSQRRADVRKRIREVKRAIKRLERFYVGQTFYTTPHGWHINSMKQSLADLERCVAQDTPESKVEQQQLPF